MSTFWNGEPCKARKVKVIIGQPPRPTWWFAALVGQARDAVEVNYNGEIFYLDNDDGQGWTKVTEGKGSPWVGHKSLVIERIVGYLD